MGKQVAARIKKKIMSRKRPHEGTAGSGHKTGRKANPTSREVLFKIITGVTSDQRFQKIEISNDW